ncbi:MAG: alanine racemase, partial [Gammaproteobacteria bacterium]|nr:alanine racemase [Gammaproteobacteria bacterium]
MKHGSSRHSDRAARIHIDGDALRHNLARVRHYAPTSQVMAVIKANAYGHGVLSAAAYLDDADAFAVAVPAEAVMLRQAGIKKMLVVLQGFANQDELEDCVEHDLQAVIHQQWQADMLSKASGFEIDTWLKIDTGMHRLGVPLEAAEQTYQCLASSAVVRSIRMMSHFANADHPDHVLNNSQLEKFINVLSGITAERSIANSGAITSNAASHLQWVRPGIMLYGSSPLYGTGAGELGLE